MKLKARKQQIKFSENKGSKIVHTHETYQYITSLTSKGDTIQTALQRIRRGHQN